MANRAARNRKTAGTTAEMKNSPGAVQQVGTDAPAPAVKPWPEAMGVHLTGIRDCGNAALRDLQTLIAERDALKARLCGWDALRKAAPAGVPDEGVVAWAAGKVCDYAAPSIVDMAEGRAKAKGGKT